VDLYIHSPIRLHGVVLNSLSTGTTLLYRCTFNRMPVDKKRARHWIFSERWLTSRGSWDIEDYTETGLQAGGPRN
jgi:hypothetical protein